MVCNVAMLPIYVMLILAFLVSGKKTAVCSLFASSHEDADGRVPMSEFPKPIVIFAIGAGI
jgi:hypothetical protein